MLFVAILTMLTGCFGASPQDTGLEGKPLPALSFLLTDSTVLRTAQLPAGQPLALFFFSPYCPHCKGQVKEITEDMDRLRDIRFCFVSGFSLPELQIFSKEYGLDKYPNISVGMDSASGGANYFEITGVPYIAIYGRQHTLNNTFMGKIYSSQLKKVAAE